MAKTVRQRTYEFTYLLPGAYTDHEAAQVRQDIDAMLKKHKAKVSKTEEWGRKQLAYVLKFKGKAHRDALYVHHVLEMDASAAPQFDREVFLSNKVMRHLMLVIDPSEVATGEAGRAAASSAHEE